MMAPGGVLVHNVAMALNVINHQSQPALSGATLSVIDPSTGEAFDTIPRSGAADIDAAVRAALRQGVDLLTRRQPHRCA